MGINLEKSLNSWLDKAYAKYEERFDYSKVTCVGDTSTILCSKHKTKISKSLKGHVTGKHGCLACEREEWIEEFLTKAKLKHGDKYSYPFLTKKTLPKRHTKVTILCPTHGEFQQGLHSHLQGFGCPACGLLAASRTKDKAIDKEQWVKDFKRKAKKVHGNVYDYSKVKYVGSKGNHKVTIVCPIHGAFKQTYGNHITLKHGCPYCGPAKSKEGNYEIKGTPKEKYAKFIKVSIKIHKGKYDYSKIPKELESVSRKVTILCPTHGEFKAIAANHMKGHDCLDCSKLGAASKGENAVAKYIAKLCPDLTIIRNDRKTIGRELDIYLPELKLAIEYCGLYWHSERFKNRMYHKDKTDACSKKGIQLITIFENEWTVDSKRKIAKSRLKSLLNVTPHRIYARKCEVSNVSFQDAKLFLEKNHLQGNCLSKIRLGLYHDGKLVSLCTFGKPRFASNNYDWELLRACSKRNTTVVGGISKLLKAFETEIKTMSKESRIHLLSYADRRWSKGSVYRTLGFKYEGTSEPNYWYSWGGRSTLLYNRMYFMKSRLPNVLDDYDPDLSARENILSNGYHRIWDCGNARFGKVIYNYV